MLFGRFARERADEYGSRPGTFEFLGFKHVCGVDARGKFAVVRISSEKSCRKFLDGKAVKGFDSERAFLVAVLGFHRHSDRRIGQTSVSPPA